MSAANLTGVLAGHVQHQVAELEWDIGPDQSGIFDHPVHGQGWGFAAVLGRDSPC